MKKWIMTCLLSLCICLLVSCGGEELGTPAATLGETESSPSASAQTTASTEGDDGPELPWSSGFVDDRQSGNQTADDPFGGNE